ncbi:MAG: YesL family protein [Lachnospiraceae bacterium]|nr:YesL family protein [Agathobacter sp.]MDD6291455.1 YesL family protein [Lachnospiraceae bacterium]
MKFSWDNKFISALGKLVDCVWLSILWGICCLPVFTIGASTSALFYTVHKSIRGSRGYTTRNFFLAFKNNFKQATLSWLVLLVIEAVLAADAFITRQVLMTGNSWGAFFYFFLVMLALVIGWACYLFPYVARFENTVKESLKNAGLLEIRHLPWSLLLIVLALLGLFLTWLIPILIFLMPATMFLLFDCILERIFRRYMSPEDLQREQENDQLDRME